MRLLKTLKNTSIKLRHIWKYIISVGTIFKIILQTFQYVQTKNIENCKTGNRTNMEQEEQQEPGAVPQNDEQQEQQPPPEAADAMEEINDRDSEFESLSESSDLDSDSDDESDSDSDRDNYDDEMEDLVELDELYGEEEVSDWLANDKASPRPCSRPPQRSLYTFKPFRLIKCHYKHNHSKRDFPFPRSGHRVIASNSHLYSLGGYNPNSAARAVMGRCVLFQELWSFNFATNRWKLLLNGDNTLNMPVELASNALAIHNNLLISHGGTGFPFGQSCSNDCYIYTTGERSVVSRLKVSGDLPTAQYGLGIIIHKHYLYTIGGTTGFDYTCDVYRLDMKTKVWENVYICRPEMREDPEGRYRHEVVYDGGHIYVLGGGTSSLVYDLQRIPAYNLETNRWDYFETLPDRTAKTRTCINGYPKPRKCLSCVQHKLSNGDIEAFITGGLQDDVSTSFDDIWKLNLNTKQWTLIHTAILPKPLYFHSAAHSDNGCMYIFGGIEYVKKNSDLLNTRRRNELYKMWMTVPKLSEMCWDAITYYNENLHRYSHLYLRESGIPNHFVERLPPTKPRKPQQLNGSHSLFSLYRSPKRARAQST